MSEWETFCDVCYYDLWRVRRKDERGFNDGFHLQHGKEAKELVELLNKLERGEANTKLQEVSSKLADALRERDEAREVASGLAQQAVRLCNERDELKMQLKVMQAERDVARISARKSDEAHDRVIGDLERADVMAEKAKELIARWDQPSWKDTAPTAGFINALRNAVEAYEEKLK
jgi:hypothetical protein